MPQAQILFELDGPHDAAPNPEAELIDLAQHRHANQNRFPRVEDLVERLSDTVRKVEATNDF